MGSKPVDNARKGKGSDRENRGSENAPKKKSGEHRKGKQGGYGSNNY